MVLVEVLIPSIVFWALLAILVVSCVVFWLLVRQWTAQRKWLALSDWAESNGFQLHGEARAIFPDVLKLFGEELPRVLISLHDRDTAIVQIEAISRRASAVRRSRWNLLVRKLASSWPTTCLRPTAHSRSVVDFLPLASMRTMIPGERFVLYSHHHVAARSLNQSAIGALLPPDIGVVLVGESLVLDFSTRPFDPLELQRVDSLAEQIVSHLPMVQSRVEGLGR